MNNITFVLDKDLTEVNRARIIELKRQYWKYDFASQIKWMQNNLNKSDIHAFLEINGQMLSYLNIVQLNVSIENESLVMFGLGNVCTNKEYMKRGLATELIKEAERLFINTSKTGLLLCHEPLVEFYSRCGWHNITNIPSSVFVAEREYNFNIMSYNLFADVSGKRVSINKNF